MKNNMYCIYISFSSLSALHYISVESGVHALDAELDATRKAQREVWMKYLVTELPLAKEGINKGEGATFRKRV